MKYAIIRWDYEKFYTHGFTTTEYAKENSENIVAYARTKADARKMVRDFGTFIAK